METNFVVPVPDDLRWYIMRTLEQARPYGSLDSTIATTLRNARIKASLHQVRCELDYLEDRKLIHIEGRGTINWAAKLSHHGLDVVQYKADCYPGINRPPAPDPAPSVVD